MVAGAVGVRRAGRSSGRSAEEDLYARGWEAGYRAAYQDLSKALMLNPALNGRRLARVLRDLTRSALGQLGSRRVA